MINREMSFQKPSVHFFLLLSLFLLNYSCVSPSTLCFGSTTINHFRRWLFFFSQTNKKWNANWNTIGHSNAATPTWSAYVYGPNYFESTIDEKNAQNVLCFWASNTLSWYDGIWLLLLSIETYTPPFNILFNYETHWTENHIVNCFYLSSVSIRSFKNLLIKWTLNVDVRRPLSSQIDF